MSRLKIYCCIAFMITSFLTGTAWGQTEQWSYMNRGNQQFSEGDFKSAEKSFDKALSLDTTNVRARYNLADSYLAQGIADKAYENFQRVAAEGKNSDKLLTSKAFHNMGVITQSTANATQEPDKKQNYLKQAIADYQQALRLNPYDDKTRYNMVLCMKQLKENEQSQSKDQQKDDKSKQESQQQEKSQKNDKKQKPEQQDKPDPPKEEQKMNDQSRQILNYARQKEQQTKDKINVLPQKHHRGKNW